MSGGVLEAPEHDTSRAIVPGEALPPPGSSTPVSPPAPATRAAWPAPRPRPAGDPPGSTGGVGRRQALLGALGVLGAAAVAASCGGKDPVEEAVERAGGAAVPKPEPKLTPRQPAPRTELGEDPATRAQRPPLTDGRSEPSAGTRPATSGTKVAPATTAAGSPTTTAAGSPATAPTTAPTTVPTTAGGGAGAPAPTKRPPAPTPAPTTPATTAAPATTSPPTTTVPPPPPGPTAEELEAMHRSALMERVTFGVTPDVYVEMESLGALGFLDRQLSIPPAGTAGVLSGGHTLDADIESRYQTYRQMNNGRPARELRHAAVLRAMHHEGQLAEIMVEFWSNHFSTYSGEDDKNVRYAAAGDDRDVIRAHAMGRFSDLLLASARSVSMQLYLDNFRSSRNRPNQNYARELMELHTMGAGNGYDEGDVDQVSYLFTGWGLTGRLGESLLQFQYDPGRHFEGPLSVDIAGVDGITYTWSTPGRSGAEGEQDGIDFVNWLARLPNTAHHLAAKLVRRFLADTPPPELVASAAQVYLANDTRIVPVLRHILTSEQFVTSRRTKVRTPFELLVAMLRATGADVADDHDGRAAASIDGQLERLGQAMWAWPTPDGFPDDRNFWITTNTVLRRWELAGRLANGSIDGITVDLTRLLPPEMPPTVSALVQWLADRLWVPVTETEITAVATFLQVATDAPITDIDVDRNLGDIVGLLLSTPVFQYR